MRFRCYNPKCGYPPRYYEFEADAPVCPKCGLIGGRGIHPLTDVHFLVMGHGPLMGQFGAHRVACEPERPHLATHPQDDYAASDMPDAVTCPRCRGTDVFQEYVKALFPHLWLQMQAEKAGKTFVDLKRPAADCGCN